MFKKSVIDNKVTSTVIGNGLIIEDAKITGDGSIRIDGRLVGELDIAGNLIIGETGHVQGDISVNHMLIAGRMDGNAHCREGIHLTSTAQFNGNIEASSLVVDDGAMFTGMSFMNTNSRESGELIHVPISQKKLYQEFSEEAL